ncbi:MAG: DUF1810 domain-containing protein [Proteobacteria bacterium]|nr:DUF1810 domain-containing protein [Pseudomonadota bacterium]
MEDPYDLERFVAAQRPVYAQVVRELGDGRKRSHWMWFVFPQLRGLGSSPMAVRYALGSLAEARAFLDHPVLGERLRACTRLVLECGAASAGDVFGAPDDLKFRSSMTLFAAAAPRETVFAEALQRLCGGERDALTIERLG